MSSNLLSLLIVILMVWAVTRSSRSRRKAANAARTQARMKAGPAEAPSGAFPNAETPAAAPESAARLREDAWDDSGSLGVRSDEGRAAREPSRGHGRREAPARDDSGSLGARPDEGRAVRDPSRGHGRPAPVPAGDNAYAEEGPPPELDAQALVQGVVMSEILTRPWERKWGRR